jgi:hypothetical protein
LYLESDIGKFAGIERRESSIGAARKHRRVRQQANHANRMTRRSAHSAKAEFSSPGFIRSSGLLADSSLANCALAAPSSM